MPSKKTSFTGYNTTLLTAVIEGVQDAIFVKDLEGRFLMMNKAGIQMTGRTREAFLGKTVDELFSAKEARFIKQKDVEVLRRKKTITYEETLTSADGKQYTYLTTKGVYKDDKTGKIIGVIGISRNITDQKKSEEILRFLSKSSKILSSSLDYERILASLAKLIVPSLADWCVIDILQEGVKKRLVTEHMDPKKVKWAHLVEEMYPSTSLDNPSFIQMMKDKEPQLYTEITDEMLVKGAKDARHLKLLRQLQMSSVMVVPLKNGEKITGLISLIAAESGRKYQKADVLLVQELAYRAAQAIDNALLYQKAREEIETKEKIETLSQQLAAIVQFSDDAILGKNLEGIITSWNKGAQQLYGYTPEEIIGKSVSLLFPEYRLVELDDIMKRIKNGESIQHLETTRITKNGEEVFVSMTISPIKNSKGVVVGASTIAKNITQQKLMEEELRRSKDQLEVIFQSVADGITVQDQSGRIVYANEAAAHIIGFDTVEKFLTTPISRIMKRFEMFDEYGNKFEMKDLPGRRALQGEDFQEALIHFTVKNSKRQAWSLVKSRPVRDSSGKVQYAINVFHDITARRELEQRRDEFMGIASHELKTPVTTVRAYTQFLKSYFAKIQDEKLLSYMEKMDSQMQKLTFLINDLLDLTRVESGKFTYHREVFSLTNILQEVVNDIQRIAPAHVLSLKARKDIFIYGDPYRVEQVITNLLTNAVKYSPNKKDILITLSKEKGSAHVSVADQGIGISKSDQKNIFERFFRGTDKHKHTYPGIGIGLYIASQIVAGHGGKIWIKSIEGKGTTSHFTIPLVKKGGAYAKTKENSRH